MLLGIFSSCSGVSCTTSVEVGVAFEDSVLGPLFDRLNLEPCFDFDYGYLFKL